MVGKQYHVRGSTLRTAYPESQQVVWLWYVGLCFFFRIWYGYEQYELGCLYTPLPVSCLTRFRFSIPSKDGQAIWGLNGPMHITKNILAKFRSHVRTMQMGAYMIDAAACRENGMAPAAYVGYDGQSDTQACMFLNPFHLVSSVDEPLVPWALRGTLLLNLTHSLVQSAAMHKTLTVEQRLEKALTCHCLWSVGWLFRIGGECRGGLQDLTVQGTICNRGWSAEPSWLIWGIPSQPVSH